MTQQVINTGAVANDGTGESLRNAFDAVNNNFANIWVSGPVDSQVVISNNRISTTVRNLALVLAGNGVGTITVDSTVVPGIDSVYDLGTANSRFDSVYSRYFYGNGAFLTGISNGSGSATSVTFAATPPLAANIGDTTRRSCIYVAAEGLNSSLRGDFFRSRAVWATRTERVSESSRSMLQSTALTSKDHAIAAKIC